MDVVGGSERATMVSVEFVARLVGASASRSDDQASLTLTGVGGAGGRARRGSKAEYESDHASSSLFASGWPSHLPFTTE